MAFKGVLFLLPTSTYNLVDKEIFITLEPK